MNVPGLVGASDNLENSALSQVVSLATLNTMSFGQIPSFLEAIGNRRPYNPVVDWIKSKPWAGVDRLGPYGIISLICGKGNSAPDASLRMLRRDGSSQGASRMITATVLESSS